MTIELTSNLLFHFSFLGIHLYRLECCLRVSWLLSDDTADVVGLRCPKLGSFHSCVVECGILFAAAVKVVAPALEHQ